MDKVNKSINDNEKAVNLNNMLLFEILEYIKAKDTTKDVVKEKANEVNAVEPAIHVAKGRKVTKG